MPNNAKCKNFISRQATDLAWAHEFFSVRDFGEHVIWAFPPKACTTTAFRWLQERARKNIWALVLVEYESISPIWPDVVNNPEFDIIKNLEGDPILYPCKRWSKKFMGYWKAPLKRLQFRMVPWFVASIRAGDYAYERFQKRLRCFNRFIREVDVISESKFFHGVDTPVSRAQFEIAKPKLLEILRMTTKIFSLFTTTSISILERCYNLLNLGRLCFRILRNISECLRETLNLEEHCIRIQTKIITHFEVSTQQFAREARLTAPSL